jgi:hypothetical protein
MEMVKSKKSHRSCGGQGVVEYILLMAAVIIVLLLFLKRQGIFEGSYNKVLTIQAEEMVNSAETIFDTL